MDSNAIPIHSHKIALSGYASSLIGGRPENQDDVGWTDTPLGFLLVVCDGMGGGPGGKTASLIAKTVVMQTLLESPEQARREDVLKMAVSYANDALYAKMNQVPSLRGMGSTIVAVLINEQSAMVAHLGDSRLYRLHGKTVLFRTQDHSLVGELVRNKVITEEQARTSPQSNVITRGLGNTSNHVAEIWEIPYRKGERFVLCTDGVWGIMPHPDLMARLGAFLDVQTIVNNLQAEVDRMGTAAGGHHDNHTLAIIEMSNDSLLKDNMSKQIKIILSVLSALLLLCVIVSGVCIFELTKAPSQDTLDRLDTENAGLIQENARLAQEISVLQNFTDSNERERFIQLTQLSGENQSLRQEMTALKEQIDSLKSELAKSKTRTPAPSLHDKEKENGKSPKSHDYSAKELADLILIQYEQIQETKENSISSVIKKVGIYRDSIANGLDQLGVKCKNPHRTNAIKNLLPSNDYIQKSIGKEGKFFIPNSYLLREFEKSKRKVEGLKQDLN